MLIFMCIQVNCFKTHFQVSFTLAKIGSFIYFVLGNLQLIRTNCITYTMQGIPGTGKVMFIRV